jgi:hypothetical protein
MGDLKTDYRMTLFKLRQRQYQKKMTFEEHVGECESAMKLLRISGNRDVDNGLGTHVRWYFS